MFEHEWSPFSPVSCLNCTCACCVQGSLTKVMKFSFKQRFCLVFKDVLIDPQDSSILLIPAKYSLLVADHHQDLNEPLFRLFIISNEADLKLPIHAKSLQHQCSQLASLKFHHSIVILPSSFCTIIRSTLFSLQIWKWCIKH